MQVNFSSVETLDFLFGVKHKIFVHLSFCHYLFMIILFL